MEEDELTPDEELLIPSEDDEEALLSYPDELTPVELSSEEDELDTKRISAQIT